jgi:hypothetical protein
VSQAATTWARSSGKGELFWYTPGTPFGCTGFVLFCAGTVGFCFGVDCVEVDNALFCLDFARFCGDSVLGGDAGNCGSSPTTGAIFLKCNSLFLWGLRFLFRR